MGIVSIFVILANLIGERWLIFVVLLFISLLLSWASFQAFVDNLWNRSLKLTPLWHSSFHAPHSGESKGRAPCVIWVRPRPTCFLLEYCLIVLKRMTVALPFSLCCVDPDCCHAMYDPLSSLSVYLFLSSKKSQESGTGTFPFSYTETDCASLRRK